MVFIKMDGFKSALLKRQLNENISDILNFKSNTTSKWYCYIRSLSIF